MAPKHYSAMDGTAADDHIDLSLPPPPPPPPPRSSKSKGSNNTVDVYYTIRSPWAWVMREVKAYHMNVQRQQKQEQSANKSNKGGCSIINSFVEIDAPSKLPSSIILKEYEQNNVATPSTPSQRRRKVPQPCTLRMDIIKTGNDNDEKPNINNYRYGIHGSSTAFDGLEDKDELVRTLQRCRCDQLNLSPPSILLGWDVTKEECKNFVGSKGMPSLSYNNTNNNNNKHKIAVLKEPMGSRGDGIHFVSSYEEIYDILQEHKKRAVNEGPEFLDSVIDMKGRIPSWVLQAEIYPPLLISGRRKFHIRTYVCVVEDFYDDDNILDVYIYNRHEVRIASHPVEEEDYNDNDNDNNNDNNNNDNGSRRRDRKAHITNGSFLSDDQHGKATERILLNDVDELVERNMQSKVEFFVSQMFGKHFVPDMDRRILISAKKDAVSYPNIGDDNDNIIPNKFCIAGLDIMATDDERLYLLEANINPAAPPEIALEGHTKFRNHLISFMGDLISLTSTRTSFNYDNNSKITIHSPVPGSTNNWLKARDILQENTK